MIDPKITKDLDNYLTYHTKLKRMKELMGGEYRMEMNVESCRPLIEDGFDLSDIVCLLYTSPSPRDSDSSRMPSSA